MTTPAGDDVGDLEHALEQSVVLQEQLIRVTRERDRYAAALVQSEQALARIGSTGETQWLLGELRRLGEEVDERDRQLRDLRDSFSWRITAPIRRIHGRSRGWALLRRRR